MWTTGDGIVAIEEWGDAVCAMHKVLAEFWECHPQNNVLRKWIFDVLKGVEKSYHIHEVAVHYYVVSQFRFMFELYTFYCPKIPYSEYTSGAQKHDRSESAAAIIPATKFQKTAVYSRPQAEAVAEYVSLLFFLPQ